MARSADLAMKSYYEIRHRLNDRLARAEREGRLDEEMIRIDRKARQLLSELDRKYRPRRRKPA